MFLFSIFADAHATRRFAANELVAAATRKTIRVPAMTRGNSFAYYRVSSPRGDVTLSLCYDALGSSTFLLFHRTTVRRTDYAIMQTRRRICGFFFLTYMHARNEYEPLLIIKRMYVYKRASQSSASSKNIVIRSLTNILGTT